MLSIVIIPEQFIHCYLVVLGIRQIHSRLDRPRAQPPSLQFRNAPRRGSSMDGEFWLQIVM